MDLVQADGERASNLEATNMGYLLRATAIEGRAAWRTE
jgi:hypothetical protein